jgi:hypothetical protein
MDGREKSSSNRAQWGHSSLGSFTASLRGKVHRTLCTSSMGNVTPRIQFYFPFWETFGFVSPFLELPREPLQSRGCRVAGGCPLFVQAECRIGRHVGAAVLVIQFCRGSEENYIAETSFELTPPITVLMPLASSPTPAVAPKAIIARTKAFPTRS